MTEDANKPTADYEVGYCKPPKGGQFTKGKSGNPKGRARGTKNLASIVRKESRQTVQYNGPHGKRKATKLELAVMQVSTKAAQGDHRATKELFELVRQSEGAETYAGSGGLNESDQKTMENLLKRMNRIPTRPTTEENQ